VYGRTDWEGHFALLLEMLGIPFTGCSSAPLAICQDKGLLKRIFLASGIPTPPGFVAEPGQPDSTFTASFEELDGRAIVKPCREDGGLGVEQASVVSTPSEALARAQLIHGRYRQAALVESFIEGRELNLALYLSGRGLVTLPPGEILFDPALTSEQRIVGWQAKWDTGSAEDLATSSAIATLSSSERETLRGICLAASRVIGMDGYCRLDLRLDGQGRFFIIDMNPNPDIGPGSGFRRALQAADVPFSGFLNQLMMTKLQGRAAHGGPGLPVR